jgi:hypothetical protein
MALTREEIPVKNFEVLANEPRYEPSLDQAGVGKIYFEISNGEISHACSITVREEDEALALAFFHRNWPVIGKMAREALDAGDTKNGEVQLVAPT